MKACAMFGIGALAIAATLMARGGPKDGSVSPAVEKAHAAPKITPYFMFEEPEEAMKLYTSLFPDSRIVSIERFSSAGAPCSTAPYSPLPVRKPSIQDDAGLVSWMPRSGNAALAVPAGKAVSAVAARKLLRLKGLTFTPGLFRR